MTSPTPRLDFYPPKTLAVMDQAFAAIWAITHGPVHDCANDSELRIAVGQKLLNLVADGVTDPGRLRQLTVESLLPGTGELRSTAALINRLEESVPRKTHEASSCPGGLNRLSFSAWSISCRTDSSRQFLPCVWSSY